MTLNANTIRELLDAAEPAPWSVARLDLHRDTGVVDNEHAVASKHLAARAPELAQDWLRMRNDLVHLARILEQFADGLDAVPADAFAAQQIRRILNGDHND